MKRGFPRPKVIVVTKPQQQRAKPLVDVAWSVVTLSPHFDNFKPKYHNILSCPRRSWRRIVSLTASRYGFQCLLPRAQTFSALTALCKELEEEQASASKKLQEERASALATLCEELNEVHSGAVGELGNDHSEALDQLRN
jgi:hypothetical protein